MSGILTNEQLLRFRAESSKSIVRYPRLTSILHVFQELLLRQTARLGHSSWMALILLPVPTKTTSLSPHSAVIAKFSCVKIACTETMTLSVGRSLTTLFIVILAPFPILVLSLPT